MTDDRIVRMLRVSESDPLQQEAADEIERLTAELAAERENYSQHILEAVHIADALRAELAAAKARQIVYPPDAKAMSDRVEALTAERDALRALLREARKLIARCDPQDFFNMLARIEATLSKGGKDE